MLILDEGNIAEPSGDCSCDMTVETYDSKADADNFLTEECLPSSKKRMVDVTVWKLQNLNPDSSLRKSVLICNFLRVLQRPEDDLLCDNEPSSMDLTSSEVLSAETIEFGVNKPQSWHSNEADVDAQHSGVQYLLVSTPGAVATPSSSQFTGFIKWSMAMPEWSESEMMDVDSEGGFCQRESTDDGGNFITTSYHLLESYGEQTSCSGRNVGSPNGEYSLFGAPAGINLLA